MLPGRLRRLPMGLGALGGLAAGIVSCALFVDFDGIGTSSPTSNRADATTDVDANEPRAQSDGGNSDAPTGNTGPIVWRGTQSAWIIPSSEKQITVARPGGASAGDVMLATIALGDSKNAALPIFTAPAGWELVRRIDHDFVLSLAVYRHVATTTEPSSYRWTSDLDVTGEAWVSAYSGVDTANPIDIDEGVDRRINGTEYSTQSLTTTSAPTLLVASFASRCSCVVLWTPPAGTTIRANLNNTDHRAGLGVDLARPAAGPTGPITATTVPHPQDFAIAHMLALRPAP